MALIMVEVEEAAERLDELVDAAVAGAEVIMGREGRPLAVMIPFENPRRRGGGAGHPAGRGRGADAPDEPGPGASGGAIVIERMTGIAVYVI